PVINAVKTFPRARKLIASTAPDETVSAASSQLRILTSVTWRLTLSTCVVTVIDSVLIRLILMADARLHPAHDKDDVGLLRAYSSPYNREECKQSGPKFSHGLHGKPPYLSGVRGGNSDRRTPHGIVCFCFRREQLRLTASSNHARLVHICTLHILRLAPRVLPMCVCNAPTYRRIASLALLRSLRDRPRAREHHGNERP